MTGRDIWRLRMLNLLDSCLIKNIPKSRCVTSSSCTQQLRVHLSLYNQMNQLITPKFASLVAQCPFSWSLLGGWEGKGSV